MCLYCILICLFAGQQCSVEQDVRDSESIFVHVKVDNDQSSMCCPTANITCNATGSSANVKTPMSTVVEHSSFIITGFERCLEYLSGCYIQYEGGQPAVCESWTIKEFMSKCSHTRMKIEHIIMLCNIVTFGYMIL